jgi:exodeoxyribonuclease VII small subunit
MPKVKKATFAQDLAELQKLAAKFESGAFDVEAGLQDFEKAMALARNLRKRLQDVEQKIESVKASYRIPNDKAGE